MTYHLIPWRPKSALTETFDTLEEAHAAAQRAANKTGDWVLIALDGLALHYVFPNTKR